MHGLVAIVGFLVCVELASGILQGYYTPIFSDIADHLGIADADVNWFEAAQLIVSALVRARRSPGSATWSATRRCCCSRPRSPRSARGCWRSRRRFTTFLIGWAIQGAYVVWLPLEVAIIHRRTAGTGRAGRCSPGGPPAILVGALELAVIIGALTSGALVESTSMTVAAGAAGDRR